MTKAIPKDVPIDTAQETSVGGHGSGPQETAAKMIRGRGGHRARARAGGKGSRGGGRGIGRGGGRGGGAIAGTAATSAEVTPNLT